jgi:hypothetical protein
MQDMKTRHLLYLLGFLPCGCRITTTSNPNSFIPGTYVREVSNEFSAGKDTLVISQFAPDSYAITNYNTYQRIEAGRLLSKEHKVERWIALLDKEAGVLKEVKRGRVLSFQHQDNKLMVGSSSYQKIK